MPKKQKVEFDDLYNQAIVIHESVENYRTKVLEKTLDLDQIRLQLIRLNLNSQDLLPKIMEDADKLTNAIQNLDEESLDSYGHWLGYIQPRLSQLEEEIYNIQNLSERIDGRAKELQRLIIDYENLVHICRNFEFQIPI
jgi:predicted  nucleic acid-binding Zn-ribbon protein